MEQVLFSEDFSCNNILYIGDNAKDCLRIIEKFTSRLNNIGRAYSKLFSNADDDVPGSNWLQHQVQFHFEGGIVIYRFRNEENLPTAIREECRLICRGLAFEQLFYAS
jgi:hypothetical protein